MKYFDIVRLIVDKEKYVQQGVTKGMEGVIIFPEIRDNTFCVSFQFDKMCPLTREFYAEPSIKIEDLELVRSANVPDSVILGDLPNHDPRWWCKVEDGFILNLKGEKKNKIPYKYDS